MVRQKMAESIRQATIYIEQGHIRVGPETITDPAYLVTRNREDFVTWVDSSKIKTKIMKYNDKVGVLGIFSYYSCILILYVWPYSSTTLICSIKGRNRTQNDCNELHLSLLLYTHILLLLILSTTLTPQSWPFSSCQQHVYQSKALRV